MTIDGKVKTYKNPNRDKGADNKPYVPQYQILGAEPREYGKVMPGFAEKPVNKKQAVAPQPLPLDNPRAKRPAIRQPYAHATASPIGRGRGPVPNVGNNMEHTWSSVDGEIIDDLSGEPVDPNHQMIDNNDVVSENAFGFQHGAMAQDIVEQSPFNAKVTLEHEVEAVHQPMNDVGDIYPIVFDLAENSYLLIVSGVPVCSGPMEEIQDQARSMVFGEHEMCDGNPISVDDIIILKRVKLKVGLFLE